MYKERGQISQAPGLKRHWSALVAAGRGHASGSARRAHTSGGARAWHTPRLIISGVPLALPTPVCNAQPQPEMPPPLGRGVGGAGRCASMWARRSDGCPLPLLCSGPVHTRRAEAGGAGRPSNPPAVTGAGGGGGVLRGWWRDSSPARPPAARQQSAWARTHPTLGMNVLPPLWGCFSTPSLCGAECDHATDAGPGALVKGNGLQVQQKTRRKEDAQLTTSFFWERPSVTDDVIRSSGGGGSPVEGWTRLVRS